ncbi:MAG: hypothetical protein J3R72DRAFT_453825 [Linnemannia gamsii]|nr:MAG: hypothetical protein J3R72DRAFT_453825 [Linnemannia gamsii]
MGDQIANGLLIVTFIRVIVAIVVGILTLAVGCRGCPGVCDRCKVLVYGVPLLADLSSCVLSVLWSEMRENTFKNLWGGESELLRESHRCVGSFVALGFELYL